MPLIIQATTEERPMQPKCPSLKKGSLMETTVKTYLGAIPKIGRARVAGMLRAFSRAGDKKDQPVDLEIRALADWVENWG